MNQLKKRQNQREVRQSIVNSFNNCVKCSKSPAEKEDHRLTKFMVCNELWNRGIDFSTEAVFQNGSRADIVIHDYQIIVEILNSEEITSFDKKNYPFYTIPTPIFIKQEQIKEFIDELVVTDGAAKEYYYKKFKEKITKNHKI